MALTARFSPAFDASDRAQFAAAWAEDETIVIHDIDSGNVDPAKVVITDAFSNAPTVFVDYRSATGGWRHIHFALEGVGGKSPVIEINRSSRITSTAPGTGWGILWTQDFVTWTKAPYPTLVSGSPNKIVSQFAAPLPSGRVYIATQPMRQEADAALTAASLLANYPTIASAPTSADSQGVYNVSPAETDDLGRSIGGRNQYAVKLSWPGPTTDGGRKRTLVMFAGIHAAGEGNSAIAHRAAVAWMLDDASAEAVAFRTNWDVWMYFNLTPNGYYGGEERTNFRTTADPNRAWAGTALAELEATKAAIITDLDLSGVGVWDAMFSWHGDIWQKNDFLCWVTPTQASSGTRSLIMQAMMDEGATFFSNAIEIDDSGTLNTDVWWAESQGARVSFDTESQSNGNMDPQFFKDVGVKWMRTIQKVDEDGWFVTPTLSNLDSSNLTATGARLSVDLSF